MNSKLKHFLTFFLILLRKIDIPQQPDINPKKIDEEPKQIEESDEVKQQKMQDKQKLDEKRREAVKSVCLTYKKYKITFF